MNKTLTVNELFSGIGAQRKALELLGIQHEVIGISEIDKYAIKSYESIYGKTRNYGDISKIEKLDYADFWTYSFPCFVEGTMVLTEEGFKPIEQITTQDKVMTHKNRFRKVIKPMINRARNLYEVSTMCSDAIYVTEEHPFFVRKKRRVVENGKNTRKFDSPSWTKARDLTRDFYVGIPINQESRLPNWDGITYKWSDGRSARHSNRLSDKFENNDFWWLIGRYIGDGWIRSGGGIIICCENSEINEITQVADGLGFNYCIAIEDTVAKIHISFKEIGEYCEQFGRGAANKRLTSDILNLPTNLLCSFLEGYISADGCCVKGLYKVTSVSRELIYGIGQCVAKVYNRPFSVYKTNKPDKYVIDGRIVNQKDVYSITFKLTQDKQDKAFSDGEHVWVPVNNITQVSHLDECNVYNLEVEEDNTYVVQNIIVHNCQDISVSGKMQGITKETRSGLLYQVERLLDIAKEHNELPKYLMLENVKNLVGAKFINQFNEWLEYLSELGYNNYWKVLNAKDYGIPQNRERVFAVSIRADIDNDGFEFPKGFDNGIRLKHLLEKNVECKFYLSQELQNRFKEKIVGKNIVGTTKNEEGTSSGQRDWVYRTDNFIGALTATDYKQPKQIIVAGNLKESGLNDQNGRVYDPDGISPTINTCGGGHREPKIIELPCIAASRGRYADDGSTVQQIELNTTGNSNTVTTVQKDNYVIDDPQVLRAERTAYGKEIRRDYELGLVKESRHNMRELKPRKDGMSNTLTTVQKDNLLYEPHTFSIRKLTPRECWRLMGFGDNDFDKAKWYSKEQVEEILHNHPKHFSKKQHRQFTHEERIERMSNSQLYKQAGNSIVVNVLYYLFKNLFKDYIKNPNSDEIINTYISNNNEMIRVGNIGEPNSENGYSEGYRVYSVEGIASTLKATGAKNYYNVV